MSNKTVLEELLEQDSIDLPENNFAHPEQLIEDFKNLFHSLNRDYCNKKIIEQVYDVDMTFQDPFHKIEGSEAFTKYCADMYENVIASGFVFHKQILGENDAFLTWTFCYSHPKLKRGRTICVEGSSEVRFNKKVYFHKDYFDGGAMLYEHIPFIGSLIQRIKGRMV